MPSFTSSVKAHHASLNSAYAAYYAPGSTRTSMASSRSNSTASKSSLDSTTSEEAITTTQLPPRNITKFLSAIKSHHADLNAAYATYYAPGSAFSSPANSAPSSSAASAASSTSSRVIGPSFEEEFARKEREQGKPRNYERVWGKVKARAVKHHEGVNAATAKIYGA